jgi:cytochrome c553
MTERMAATPGFAMSPSHTRRHVSRRNATVGTPWVVAFALAALLYLPSSGAATASDRGAQLAALCAACHRLDSKKKALPSIVGRQATNLAAAMQAFRSGKRPSQIMHAVALSLSEDEIAAIARYLTRYGAGP